MSERRETEEVSVQMVSQQCVSWISLPCVLKCVHTVLRCESFLGVKLDKPG